MSAPITPPATLETALYEMIRPMSESDALLAVQAFRAADEKTAESALEAMSKDGLKLLVALLEAELKRRRGKSCEDQS